MPDGTGFIEIPAAPRRADTGPAVAEHIYDDAVVLNTANTTVGYARFSRLQGTLEYIFVNPAFRRRGYGRRLIALCERECGAPLTPSPPVSPLGRRFFAAPCPFDGIDSHRCAPTIDHDLIPRGDLRGWLYLQHIH